MPNTVWYALSSHLFNLYTEQIMREAETEYMGIWVSEIGGRVITNVRYAGDTALKASVMSMRRILYQLKIL